MNILKTKSKLHDIKKYDNVYINTNQTNEMRQNSRNLKVLIKRLGVSGLKLRGNRLVLEDSEEDNNQARQPRAFEYSSSSEANPWQQQKIIE
ncbi:hypothetical protein DPMN_088331 [Dreissena polymorpha]|uniref:Uncharacterized protein n=1 Tax=Dreissena polymorpha TaxID=45954 RepID=A0A9D4KTX0_DREPO|nr:hypothetical protein DPMN_088331 [Dreissena polymorpha]